MAKVLADKHIVICDKEGRFVKNWLYLSGPLKKYGHYFKFRTTQGLSDAIVSNLTLLIAKQLMPSLAMAWITEDKEVLEAWFRALNIMDAFFGLHQMALDVEALMRSAALDMTHEDEHFIADASVHGEAFWEWLVDHVNQKESDSSLKTDGIGLIDGELLFDIDEMSKRYCEEHKVDAAMVEAQFATTGIAQMYADQLAMRKVHEQAGLQGGVVGTGMYAQQARQEDKLDAKRFVGVDASIASAYFKGYNGLSNNTDLSVERSGLGIMQRLASIFLGNLSDGIDLINSGGSL